MDGELSTRGNWIAFAALLIIGAPLHLLGWIYGLPLLYDTGRYCSFKGVLIVALAIVSWWIGLILVVNGINWFVD